MEKKTDIRALPPKTRVQYIWDYYKWHIIIPLVLLIIVINIVHNYITYQEPILNVIMINSTASDLLDDTQFDGFLTEYGYRTTSDPISLNALYQFPEDEEDFGYTANQALQSLNVVLYAGGQDLFFGNGRIFMEYVDDGLLTDLSTVLSEDTMEQYADAILYCNYVSPEDETGETVYTYPAAIFIDSGTNEWLKDSGYYDSCYFGILQDADHPEAAVRFAEYILTQ